MTQKDFDLQSALEEYPDLERFLGTFQIRLRPFNIAKTIRRQNIKDYIVVFKKKKPQSLQLRQTSKQYWENVAATVGDPTYQGKALGSCLRCRKFKKKCSRQLPECLNCTSCDELCVYPSHSMKRIRLSPAHIDKNNTSISDGLSEQRRCSDVYRLLN